MVRGLSSPEPLHGLGAFGLEDAGCTISAARQLRASLARLVSTEQGTPAGRLNLAKEDASAYASPLLALNPTGEPIRMMRCGLSLGGPVSYIGAGKHRREPFDGRKVKDGAPPI